MKSRKRSVGTIGEIAVIILLLVATTLVASAQCNYSVSVDSICCYTPIQYTTAAWFFNTTINDWIYDGSAYTVLFHLSVDGVAYDAYCIDYELPLSPGNTFNASIYPAAPTCKNNSIAYILNNWTHDCAHCANVAAGQSAIWYFQYINESFCSLGTPEYNHTAVPPVESRFIPDCAAHPEACEFVNASINKSVPYAIATTPSSGSFPKGTPIVLTATVSYCAGVGEGVTVVFEADNGTFSENGSSVYENVTEDEIATATLVCDPSVDSVHVTVGVKDMKWFEIVAPCNGYQPTLRIVNITDDAAFSFSEVVQPGGVDGYVYEDRSCNCSYEPTYPEPGVPGVTVELVNVSTGLVVNTTTTDSNGYYNFTNVSVGNYTVRYNASTLPPHLTPKCDDDSGADSGIPAINTSNPFDVPEGGTHRHNFGVKAILGISIEKLVNGEKSITAARNDTVTFTLNITNTGLVNLTNLSVYDALPLKKANKGLSWTFWAEPPADGAASSLNPEGWIHFTIEWWGTRSGFPNGHLTPFEPLEPGESFVITFNATVDPEAEGMLCDYASVRAKGEGWCLNVTDNDDACVLVLIERVPVLMPIGIAVLIGVLSVVILLSMKRKKG